MRKIIPFIFGLLLLSVLANAGLNPEPVAVDISVPGYPDPEGLKVVQTNLRTGISYESVVDVTGFSLVDWSNLPHLQGDKVEVAIKLCKDKPECKRVVSLDGDPISFSLVAPSGEVIELIKEEVKYKYVCADKSVKDTADECPEVQRVIVPSEVLVCPTGERVASSADCPKGPWVTVSIVIGLVAAGLLILYLKDKKKYKWAPGLAGILKAKLAKAKKLKDEGKEAAALKELQSAEKTANTVLKKYLTEELKK